MKRSLILTSTALALPLLALGAKGLVPPSEEETRASLALESLGWMAGHWRLESAGGRTEELWMPPAGGLMLGLNRTLELGRPTQFEFLRIEERTEGIFYLASPGGAPATPFVLTECEEGRALFENPEHDFPTRIEYRRQGDQLSASIAGEDSGGPSWSYVRVADVD